MLAVAGGGTGKSAPMVTGNMDLNLAFEWAKTSMNNARMQSTVQRVEAVSEAAAKEVPATNSYFHELAVLLRRNAAVARRDKNYLMIHLGKNVVIALILLSVFYNVNSQPAPNVNALALIFMVVTQWSLNGIAYIAPLIQEREVFYRERQSGAYRCLSYYFAKVLIDLPFTILSVIIYGSIIYWGCGFPSDAGKYFIFLLGLFLVAEAASGFAHFVSAVSPTTEFATGIAPMVLILFLIFSGFLLTTSQIPVYWRYTVRYISFVAYGFQALGYSTFKNSYNEAVIPLYQLDEYSVATNLLALFAMVVMWRLFAFMAIKYVRFYKR